MATQANSRERVTFGQYELDCRTGELLRKGVAVKLQPQPARVLSILVNRAGEIVTREELAEQVWGSETYVDFEHGLNFAIRKIRSVLEDNPEQPHFVETIPKRGYRFVARVTILEPTGQPTIAAPVAKPSSRLFRRNLLYGGAVVVAVIIGLIYLRTSRVERASANRIQSLAVLPLRNLSNDPGQEYFSDGMTDELITDLAKAGGLRVISHTSVERYKGTTHSLPEIARELGSVDAIVEGTVLRAGNRVRITAQLIDARSDQHLWADSYERDARDVLALQGDVAKDIANEVAVKLTPSQGERLWTARPVVPEAHEAYLKGIFDASKLTTEGIQSGVEHFDEAIRLDSAYAPAYAGKAEAYLWASAFDLMPAGEVLPKAKTAVNKALELDDTLSQAHHSLAWVNYALDWNFKAAEAEFRRAVELNANDVTAHLWYGMFLAQRGRIKESIAEMKRAQALDPLSLMVNGLGATPLLDSGQYDAAIEQVNKVLVMDPSNGLGHWMLLTAYERKGDLTRAIDEREKQVALWGQSPENTARQTAPLRKALASSGDIGYWKTLLGPMEPDLAKGKSDPYGAAVVLARAGEKERALAALEKSCAARSTELLYSLYGEPAFDSMSTNPRFQNLLHQIGVQPDHE